jgi:nitrite reductase (NADH) large subunit
MMMMMMIPFTTTTTTTTTAFLLATIHALFLVTTNAFVVVPPHQHTPLYAFPSKTALDAEKKRVVVIGNGMVGQRFMENLLEDVAAAAGDNNNNNNNVDNIDIQLATFCEEPRAAYNRVKLTSYFETRNPSDLSMTSAFDADGRTAWYQDHGVELYLGDRAIDIDTHAKTVTGSSGTVIEYDACVLATGSFPFVPPIPGKQRPGVFVYRTIEDLESMLAYAQEHNVQSAAVIGGGLLGKYCTNVQTTKQNMRCDK